MFLNNEQVFEACSVPFNTDFTAFSCVKVQLPAFVWNITKCRCTYVLKEYLFLKWKK